MPPSETTSLGRYAYVALCATSIALIAFVAGGVATLSDARAGRVVKDAYTAGTALYAKYTQYSDVIQPDLWRPARTAAQGVTIYDPLRAQNGFTVFTSGDRQAVQLIDMQGRVMHEWALEFSRVWDQDAAVRRPVPDSQIYIERAKLLPDGSLLALYVAVGDTPWGYGVVKLDRDSQVVWKYLQHAHHDLDVGPDGRVYVLTQDIGTDTLGPWEQLKPPRIDDNVAILAPDGTELKRIRIIDALLKSPYFRVLDTVPWYIAKGTGDYLHTNAVNVLDGHGNSRLPQATAGRVLLSFREINAIAILDVETEEIVWARRGVWLRQHDPDLLPNGNMLVFDNQGGDGPGGVSRIIEFDPRSQAIVWQYEGTAEHPFESDVRSAQERLANGNTLITESDGGRLFEVTPTGETVWEFVNPTRVERDGQTLIPIVQWAERVDAPWLFPRVATNDRHP